MKSFQVTSTEEGLKLLDFLALKLAHSKRAIKRLLDGKRCRVDGQIERFATVKLRAGMHVEIWLDLPVPEQAKVLFEDEWLVVVDKPSGLCFDAVLPENAPVHRLDKETSGVMLFAKTEEAQRPLEDLFRNREIEKRYLAFVHGVPPEPAGLVENDLGRIGPHKWGVVPRGKRACTHYQLLRTLSDRSLVACMPETGRTHQLRIHLAGLGCPVVGDAVYGRHVCGEGEPGRCLLHAERLRFIHPFTGEELEVMAPAGAEFEL